MNLPLSRRLPMQTFLPLKHIKAPPHLLSEPHPMPSQQDLARVLSRCFSTWYSNKDLSHMEVMTYSRAYGPDVADNRLRDAEGQLALVASILRLIDRGRKS